MEQEDDEQRAKIEAEKRALSRQLYCLIFMSLLVAAGFYIMTRVQNPDLKPSEEFVDA